MTTPPNASPVARMTTSAVAIVPGPYELTLTFILRNSGVFAGHWLLPSGQVNPGESAEHAARRKAEEETGVHTGALAPTGIYDVRGRENGVPFWFRLHVYRSLVPCGVPTDFVANPTEVSQISQAYPHEILPHPTDMRILNDVGMADYEPDLVDRLLAADGVAMSRVDAP